MYLFAHQLPKEAYGQYQNFWSQLNVFNALLTIGIPVLIFNYSPNYILQIVKGISHSKKGLYIIFIFALAIGFGALQSYQSQLNIGIAAGFLALFSISLLLESALLVFRRFKILLISNFLYAMFFLGAHIYWLQQNVAFDYNALFLVCLIGNVIKCCIQYWDINKSFSALSAPETISLNEVRETKRLWGHLYLLDIISICFIWIDKFIVSLVLSPEDSAVYVNGTLNIPFLPIIFSAVSSATLMVLADTQDRKDIMPNMRKLGSQLGRFAFPIFFYFLILGNVFITVFFSEKYVHSIPIFLCTICVLPLRAYNYSLVLQKKGRGNIINLGAIIDLVIAVAMMYPLYQWWGLTGLSLSFVISTYFQAIFYLYHSAKTLDCTILDIIPLKNWLVQFIFYGLLTFVLYICFGYILSGLSLLCVVAALLGVVILRFAIKSPLKDI